MVHIGKLIEEKLRQQGRSVSWFAGKLYYDRTNVYSIFKKKSIDTDLLLRISHVLDYNFSIATIKTLNESTAVLTSYEKDEEGEFYNEITFKKK